MPGPERRLEDSLGHWAARLSWAARGALERRLKPLGVSPPMMAALLAVGQGAERATDVAAVMGVDAAAVTRLLERLSEAGLIGRCASAGDKRSRRIELSAKAKALLPKLKRASADVEAAVSEGLGAAKKEALIQALRDLTRRAEAFQETP